MNIEDIVIGETYLFNVKTKYSIDPQHSRKFKVLSVPEEGSVVGRHINNIGEYSWDSVVNTGDLMPISDYQDLKESRLKKHPFKGYIENGIKPGELSYGSIGSRLYNYLNYYTQFSLFSCDLEFFFPNVDVSHADFVYLWLDQRGREKGRDGRVRMKPGRAFRKIFPLMPDTELEHLVENFKRDFSPVELTVHSGKEAKDFLHAYTGDRLPDRNFSTTDSYKRMCDSCMRYDFNTPVHPVETYASGDWTIFWTEGKDGKVGSRCIAYLNEDGVYQLGPIYATCQDGIDKLKEHFKGLNTSGINEGKWEGARILKVEDNGYVGPYFDCHSTLTEDGKYLVLDSSGDIEHHHEGRYEQGCRCGYCGEFNGSTMYVESVDLDVCETCRVYDFFVSDYDGELYLNEYRVEVMTSRNWSESWTDSQVDCNAFYSEDLGEWVKIDVAVETYESEYIPNWYLEDGSWFICSVDELAWPIDQIVETKTGPVAKDNYEEEVA